MATELIDMTPDSMKTPEGVAKVNAALEVWQSAQADMANASLHFFKEFGDLLEQASSEVREDLAEINEKGRVMLKAQEAFLRAVAGRD